jgi:hypothetical protein
MEDIEKLLERELMSPTDLSKMDYYHLSQVDPRFQAHYIEELRMMANRKEEMVKIFTRVPYQLTKVAELSGISEEMVFKMVQSTARMQKNRPWYVVLDELHTNFVSKQGIEKREQERSV